MITTWAFVVEAAPYLLFGFALAGALHLLVRRDRIVRWIGRPGPGSVARAAVVGVPLPLCSCGVVPVAAGLRREGADLGAATSFLIATPETGVDSIAISWALLDPLMTVFRPLAAFAAAIAGGLAQQVVDRRGAPADPAPHVGGKAAATAPAPPATTGSCCAATACCGDAHAADAPAPSTAPPHATHAVPAAPPALLARVRGAGRFAFVDLFTDMGGAILLGMLLSGALIALLPDADPAALRAYGGLPAMLAMLVVGVPIYVCATSATPLAAAVIAKGLSPGAALVFLLAGPATNLAGLAMLAPILGRRGLAVYVAAIMACALAAGLLLDALYPLLGLTPTVFLSAAADHGADPDACAGALCLDRAGWVAHATAVVLVLLAAAGWWRAATARRRAAARRSAVA